MRIVHVFSIMMLVFISSAHSMLRRSGRVEGLRRLATQSVVRRVAELERLSEGLPDSKYRARWAEKAKVKYLTGGYSVDDVSRGSVGLDEARVLVQLASDIEKEGLERMQQLEPELFDAARAIVRRIKDDVVMGGVVFVGMCEVLPLTITFTDDDWRCLVPFDIALAMLSGGFYLVSIGSDKLHRARYVAQAIKNGGSPELISDLKARLERLNTLN